MEVKRLSLVELYDLARNINRFKNTEKANQIDQEIELREARYDAIERTKRSFSDYNFFYLPPSLLTFSKGKITWEKDGRTCETHRSKERFLGVEKFSITIEKEAEIECKVLPNEYGSVLRIDYESQVYELILNSMSPFQGIFLLDGDLSGFYDRGTIEFDIKIPELVGSSFLSVIYFQEEENSSNSD